MAGSLCIQKMLASCNTAPSTARVLALGLTTDLSSIQMHQHDECCTGPKWRVHAHTHGNAEASLPVPRSPRASFLSRASPVPGSRPPLSRFAASDMGLSSWAYAADFIVEKSSLKKNLGSFCFHKNTSFYMTCEMYVYHLYYCHIINIGISNIRPPFFNG